MNKYAICHSPCHDGLASAWVAKQFDPTIEIFHSSRKHEWREKLAPKSGDMVYFIDICPEAKDLENFQKRSVDFLVLDHHETDMLAITKYDTKNKSDLLSLCKFDMKNAGCIVAWHHFFHDEPIPKMLEYIAIADMWGWRDDNDHAAIQYIRTELEPDASVEEFDALISSFDENAAIALGGMVYKRICKEVSYSAKHGHLMSFDGTEVLAVNTSLFHSEIGHELSLNSPSKIGVIYTYSPANDGVKLSFRGEGANRLAEKYGGGGHPQAAGCYMTLDQFDKYLKTSRKNVIMEA